MSLMQGRQEAVDAPMECLMFAIYYSSVISLSAADCLQELGEERHILLQRYVVLPWISGIHSNKRLCTGNGQLQI